jgi:hypothetical protein
MTDRLTLAHALEEGGMARAAAEHVATEIYEAIYNNVATKTDLRELEARLGKVISDSHAALLKWMVGQTFVILGVVAALHFVK